jgi:hypothetical protein
MRSRQRLHAFAVSTALAAFVLQLAVRPTRAQPDTDLSSLPDGRVTTPPPTTGCPDGFAGVNCHACEEDTYSGGCTAQCNAFTMCAGNGRCRGKDGTCICDEGWTGANCTTYAGVTRCPEGFSGIDCQVCDENMYSSECIKQCNAFTTCAGNGRCRGKDGTCICDEGWTGANCTTYAGVTRCPEGFSGIGCQVCDENMYSSECIKQCNAFTTCAGNGRCRGKDGTCICDEGWTGAGCSIPTSVTTPLPTTGWVTTSRPTTGWVTTPPPTTGWVTTPQPTTECPDGFAGVNCHACEEDTYSGGCTAQCNAFTTCAGNGRCRGKDGTCICEEGWTGANCTTYAGVTRCPEGFSGIGCQVCDENMYSSECIKQCNAFTTCSGNGRCRGKDGTCICDEGWTGIGLQHAHLGHHAPADHGVGYHVPPGGGYHAQPTTGWVTTPPPTTGCPDGFSGVNCHACEEDTYSGGCTEQCNAFTTCAGNGRCRGKGRKCICDEGWTGVGCSIPRPPSTTATTPPRPRPRPRVALPDGHLLFAHDGSTATTCI